MKVLVHLMVMSIALGSHAEGCALSMGLPQDHYNGVDEEGYVSYWEKIGEVPLDDKNTMSVSLSFDSHREASSPYLGKGWMIPLLESHVEPINENGFKIIMPDGLNYYFGRSQRDSNMYAGNRGWLANTNGETLTAWAPCGWKIVFLKGKIQEMTTPEGRVLSYKYNGAVAGEIVDDKGSVLIQVDDNTGTGAPSDILISGNKINMGLAQRPRVLNKGNQNLIIGFDQSLRSLQTADKKEEAFVFSTDKSLNPTLEITGKEGGKRNFVWDSNTRQIKIDGDWTYKVRAAAELNGQIDQARINKFGQYEYYIFNPGEGRTIERTLDGTTTVTEDFVNNNRLNGEIRKIVSINSNGAQKVVYQASYDEEGRVIREIGPAADSKDIEAWTYDTQGNIQTHTVNALVFDYIATKSSETIVSVKGDDGIDPVQFVVNDSGRISLKK